MTTDYTFPPETREVVSAREDLDRAHDDYRDGSVGWAHVVDAIRHYQATAQAAKAAKVAT